MSRPEVDLCPKLPAGFRAASVATGLKPNRDDLGLLLTEQAQPAAVVFTNSQLLGAHIPVCRDHLRKTGGMVRAVLVNAGNANCATGAQGEADARHLCTAVAERLECAPAEVLSISTGVIGQPLTMAPMLQALDPLITRAQEVTAIGASGLQEFAEAILTTDTHPKWAATDARTVGVAKGSGMVHPDMATMLAFFMTSACATPDVLRAALQRTIDESFHRLSIDGDTSPNDTVMLWGAPDDAVAKDLVDERALTATAVSLCRQIAGDGEGASRRITITVRGLPTSADAVRVGRVLATSPLVKTAIAGRDPNWGRLVAAAARAGVPMDPAKMDVAIGGHVVFEQGAPQIAAETHAAAHLRSAFDTEIEIDCGKGLAEATVWSCDLTGDYIRINADYRS